MVSTMTRYSLAAASLLQALALAQANVDAAATKTISFPASQPSGSVSVPGNFVGFGFDGAFLNSYDNEFSNNLVNSVASRMSTPPTIRIGGTSADKLFFNPNQKQNTTCIAGPCPFGSGATFVIGPSYFQGFKSFPNSPMTFQIPLRAQVNVSNIVDFATRAYPALGSQRVAAIAIGNEVAGYEKTAADYVAGAHQAQQAVVTALKLSGADDRIFEVLDLASGSLDTSWTLADAFQQGLDNNTWTRVAGEHWYQIDSTTPGPLTLQGSLMNHTAITNKFTPYGQALKYLQQHRPNIAYVLSETGSVLGDGSEWAPLFGSCLWAVDFNLYTMSQGVARVAGTQRPQAQHSLWVPIPGVTGSKGPEVRANYYASHLVADFVGSSGKSSVRELDLSSDTLSAYGAWEGGSLARVALVNLHVWSTGNGTRPQQTFAVNVPKGVQSVQVARLHAAGGALAGGYDFDGQNITYAGQQWSYSLDNGKGHPATQSRETVAVKNGVASISVPDSEAVLVYIKS